MSRIYEKIQSLNYMVMLLKKYRPADRYLTFSYIRNLVIAYLVVILPLAGFSWYKVATAPKEKAEALEETVFMPMVKVFRVKQENYNDTLAVNGTVKGTSEIDIKFEIAGKVATFNFREGQTVSKGEIILSLDPEDVMTRLRHSKSKQETVMMRWQASKEKLKVYQELYEMGAIIKAKMSEMELSVDSMKSEVESAKAEVQLAKSHLEKTVFVAPADGVMGIRKVEVGDFATPQDIVGTFLEVREVFVEMGVIEKDINKIKIGQKVQVEVDAYADEIFWGTIDNIAKMVRGQTRTLPVKVRIKNPGNKLLSGMYADCEIYLASFNDRIIIPTQSVIDLGNMTVVPLIKPGEDHKTGIVELRKIETGYSSSYTVIEDGLIAGDLIVLETQQPLKDSMKVKIIEVIESSLND